MINLTSISRTGLPCLVIMFLLDHKKASLQQKKSTVGKFDGFYNTSQIWEIPSGFVFWFSSLTVLGTWAAAQWLYTSLPPEASHSRILLGFGTYWCKCVTVDSVTTQQWSFVVSKIYLVFNGTFTKTKKEIKLRTSSSFKNVFGSNKAQRFQWSHVFSNTVDFRKIVPNKFDPFTFLFMWGLKDAQKKTVRKD